MNHLRSTLVLACFAAVHLVHEAATAQPTLRLIPVGLTDSLHTDPETELRTGWFPFSPIDGLVIGASLQSGASNGWTLWAFDPATEETTLLGLRDAEHTASNGGSSSSLHAGSRWRTPGFLFGHSVRYVNDAPLGQSAWRYRVEGSGTIRIGLFDDEHTNSASHERVATATNYSTRGDAIGWSRRYVGGSFAGQSAWYTSPDSNETVRIGLVDAAHTAPVGVPARHSQPVLIADCGVVAGLSDLYHSAPLPPGKSAWVFDPSTGATTRAGLVDSEHIDPSGYHNSTIVSLTPDGTVIGTSERFANGQNLGTTLWFVPRGAPQAIALGLTDEEHTGASGTRASALVSISDQAIAGVSTRWLGGWSMLGRTAWVYDRSTGVTIRLGLTDAEHTSSAGARSSYAGTPLADGRVLGSSQRYSGSTITGFTSWLWDPADGAYTRLGFTDPIHTRPSNGYRQSGVRYVTPTGFAVGYSYRWTPDERLTAWAYELATGQLTVLGISDAEHVVDSSGLPDSESNLNGIERGYGIFTAGKTRRANGGYTPWFRDPRTDVTLRVGPFDARHTGPSGERDIGVNNDDLIGGRTVGSAARYIGADPGGRTPFVFNSGDGITTPIVFSERPDGYAWSSIQSLTEDGTVIGSFLDHDTGDGVSFRGYIWRLATGMTRLDEAIEDGFESAGYRMNQYESSELNIRASGEGVWNGVVDRIDGPGRRTFVLVSVPCIADFDGDGEVGSADFFAFLAAWFAHDPSADLDGEGGVDSGDFFAFLGAFFAGCG